MSKFNPYEILDVSKTDDISVIEKKFKRLAVKYHPDKNKSIEAIKIYENLSKAKDILTDPEKKSRYDKYGITDETESREFQEKMQQEMMLKHKLREVVKLNIQISDILNGFTKDIKIKRDIINSKTRKQTYEQLDIKIVFNSTDPFNKPIILKDKGKKYDDICGDLIITFNIQEDSLYKINKSNHNLIITQKISLAQSLCGFETTIKHLVNKPIIIQHDTIIKPNSKYVIKNMGLNIMDDNGILSKSDIEIHFDIKYNLNQEMIEKLKLVFNYTYTKSDTSSNSNIHSLEEYKEPIHNSSPDIRTVFDGIPGFGGMSGMHGMPGMPGMHGMPGMPGMPGMSGQNVQECHMQ